jgi:hypothetical protein
VNDNDRILGMNRDISRRDFINGVAMAAGTLALPISIANADAAASPHTDAAFLEAHRAVSEVLERRAFPFAIRDT